MITLVVNLLFITMGIPFLSPLFHTVAYIRDSDHSLKELML